MIYPHTPIDYRPDIDGLRAIAVLSVLIFHVFPSYFSGGFIGVDIFFVISGYLISTILFKKLTTGNFSLLEFYIKRTQRIAPALIMMLMGCFLFGYFSLFADELSLLAKHMIAASTFTSNFILWQEAGYFDKAAQLKPLLHLWSLGIEEQFYLLWPLITLGLWKLKGRTFYLIIFLASLSFLLNIIFIHHHQVATFYLPFTRSWELILGGILAYLIMSDVEPKKNRWLNYIYFLMNNHQNFKSMLSILVIILTVFFFNNSHSYPGFFALLPTMATVLLITSKKSLINQYFLSNQLMVFIGLISYPLYLWHWPILAYINIISPEINSIILGLIIILVSIFLASITYFLERHIRSSRSSGKKSISLFLLLLFIGSLGYLVIYNKGLPNRDFVKNKQNPATDIANFEEYRHTMLPCAIKGRQYKEMSWCLQSRKGKPDFVLWGDSHADHLFPGISEADKKHNWLLIGNSSCPPLLGVNVYNEGQNQSTCINNNKIISKFLVKNKSTHTIILASLGAFYINDTNFAAEHKLDNAIAKFHMSIPSTKKNQMRNKQQIFYYGIDKTIKKLEAHGKKVIIFQDIPEIPFMPQQCIKRPFAPQFDCTIAKSEVLKRQKQYKKILLKLKKNHPKMVVFDSTEYLCPGLKCLVKLNDHLIYRDSHHLSLFGSKLIASYFLGWKKDSELKTELRVHGTLS